VRTAAKGAGERRRCARRGLFLFRRGGGVSGEHALSPGKRQLYFRVTPITMSLNGRGFCENLHKVPREIWIRLIGMKGVEESLARRTKTYYARRASCHAPANRALLLSAVGVGVMTESKQLSAEVVDLLVKVPLFSQLSSSELAKLAKLLKRKRLRAGETLFLEGSVGSYLYIIASGAVRILTRSVDGREVQVALLGPFDVIGELSALDGKPRSGEARAAEPTELYMLSAASLRSFVLEHPTVGWELLKVLASRLRKADEAVADAAFLDVPGRLAKRLLELGETQGTQTAEGVRIRIPLTQEELAAMIGATREGVNRALSSFASMGFLERRGRYYVLKDVEALRRRAAM